MSSIYPSPVPGAHVKNLLKEPRIRTKLREARRLASDDYLDWLIDLHNTPLLDEEEFTTYPEFKRKLVKARGDAIQWFKDLYNEPETPRVADALKKKSRLRRLWNFLTRPLF